MTLETRAEVKELSKVERELSVVIPGDQVAKELDKAYRKLSQKVRLKGFRPGKVPRYVLEQYYKEQTEADVLENLVSASYRAAVEDNQLTPVAPPDIQTQATLIAGMDFTYQARVEIKPEVELKSYKGLSLKKTAYHVADESVTRELDSLRQRFVKIVPVEGRDVVQQGDLVQCNWSGTVDGEYVKGLNGVSYVIEVGAGDFYAEAEQALVGKKLQETFEVEVTLADDFRVEAVRGKKAKLSMKAEQLKHKHLPALDDEFAKDVSDNFESLEDLKKNLRERLEQQAEFKTKNEIRDRALDALIEQNPFDVPNALVTRHAEQLAADALGRLPEEHARRIWEAQGTRLTEDARPRALKQVRAGLILEAVAKAEAMSVSEEDIDGYLERLAEDAGQPMKTLRNLYKSGRRRDELKGRLSTEKALDFVVAEAKVEEETAAI